ncbi:MAG: DUF1499 domain-containing protein [Cyanobacteria bacterium P01_E01_bin.34]
MAIDNFKQTVLRTFVLRLTRVLLAAMLALMVSISPATPAIAASPNNQASQQFELGASPEAVFDAAQQAFESWSRGELVDADRSTRVVTGVSRTNLFKFVDDISVAIASDETNPDRTSLSISSVGRMGEYDFGGNKRNISEYIDALKALL